MYFLGIDGGGTKTKIVLMDEYGKLLGSGVAGPSSIRSVTNDVTKQSFSDALKETLKDVGNIVVTSVFAGLGDIESEEDSNLVASMIKEFDCVNDNTVITVKSDVYNALYGGLGSLSEGVSVILGTGSVAMGIDSNMNTSRVGGYSYKEGDPGSSYYIGKLVLSYVAKVLDSRKKESDFSKELFEILNITTRLSYVEMLDIYHEDRTKTAGLARLVTKHASLGCLDALEILNNSVDGASELIDTCVNNLGLSELNVAIIGGLGNSKLYFELLSSKLHSIDSNYSVFPNVLDPSLGSYIGALKAVGASVDEKLIGVLKGLEL